MRTFIIILAFMTLASAAPANEAPPAPAPPERTAPDPAKIASRKEKRKELREACKAEGKKGKEIRDCMKQKMGR